MLAGIVPVDDEPIEVARARDGKEIPKCFHLNGYYANCIIDSDGNCRKLSKEVRLVDGDKDCNKNYFQYIGRFSKDEHRCIICEKDINTDGLNGASNMVNHIRKTHKYLIPYDFMPQAYINQQVQEWEHAEKEAKKKRKIAEPQPVVNCTGARYVEAKAGQVGESVSKGTLFGNGFKKVTDLRKAILYSLILGFLPLAFIDNVGLRYLVIFFMGAVPVGISARSLRRDLTDLYNKFIKDTSDSLKMFIPKPLEEDEFDLSGVKRVFGVQHDGWSTRFSALKFLGICLDFIDVAANPWIKRNVTICCEPFEGAATAESALENITLSLARFGIFDYHLTSATQDTTGSSFNVFNNVDNVAQLRCMAHVLALVSKHIILVKKLHRVEQSHCIQLF
jgi:hypothetical protein